MVPSTLKYQNEWCPESESRARFSNEIFTVGKQNPHFGGATSSPQTQTGFQGITLWQPLQQILDWNSMLNIRKAHSKICNDETDYQPAA